MESIQVAIRIRPMIENETKKGCRPCIEKVKNESQIIVGHTSQPFSFSFVFDEYDGQATIYNSSVQPLISRLFEGYNVTILAYGQTGTGKTFTMGTNYNGDGEMGVIPRALIELFDVIKTPRKNEKFEVSVSFLELYNEVLYDLLTGKDRTLSIVEIRDTGNTNHIPGLTSRIVNTADDALKILNEASNMRVTGATAMNIASSRSHAVFTISIKKSTQDCQKTECITSKLHLVDLAGSERSKKTGTTGERFKEGVNINKGLLVLGNVISQLSDNPNSYINYRDSKLTRLLQDSLGGNSCTLMIACVSPADTNQSESLGTLRYADRVKKIKNKPIINVDPQARVISELRKENEELKLQLIAYGTSGNCPPEHAALEENLTERKKINSELSCALKEALSKNTIIYERLGVVENMLENTKSNILELEGYLKNAAAQNVIDLSNGDVKKIYDLVKVIKLVHLKSGDNINNAVEEHGNPHDYNACIDDNLVNSEKISDDYLLAQAKVNQEISNITINLLLKQEMYDKLTLNSQEFQNLNDSELSVEDLKSLVKKLKEDKDNLLSQLQKDGYVKKDLQTPKIPPELQQKLSKLEKDLNIAQRKLTEQEKMIKLKEKAEEKIVLLRNEIKSMKTLKVNLIHQMKQESVRFRNWESQKTRELCKLKNLTMKQNHQISQMEKEFTLRQAVWRRKLESAAAAKKRMEKAVDRKKISVEKKLSHLDPEKLEEYVSAEIEMLESYLLAKKSLQRLLDDRTNLMTEISSVNEMLENQNISASNKEYYMKRQLLLQEDLDLMCVQIADLQQRLLDNKQGEQTKKRWNGIKTLSEAKFALDFLFSYLSKLKKDYFQNIDDLSELKSDLENKIHEIENLNVQLKDQELKFEKDHYQTVRDYEDKINTILTKQKDCLLAEKENILSPKIIPVADVFKSVERNTVQNGPTLKRKISSYEEAFEKFIKSNSMYKNCDPDPYVDSSPVKKRRATESGVQLESNSDSKSSPLDEPGLVYKNKWNTIKFFKTP